MPRTATKNSHDEMHPPLNSMVVDQLLTLLSTDDAYRERFAQDPVSALSELGYYVPQDLLPTCMATHQLASKEQIAEAREKLKSLLMSVNAYFVPHCMDVDRIGDFSLVSRGPIYPSAQQFQPQMSAAS